MRAPPWGGVAEREELILLGIMFCFASVLTCRLEEIVEDRDPSFAAIRRKVEEPRRPWLASCFMPSPIFVVLMSYAILDYQQCNHDPITNNYSQHARSQSRRGAGLPCSDSLSSDLLLFPTLSVVSLDDTLSFTLQRQIGFNTNTSYIILSLPVLYLYDGLLVPSVV